MTAMPEVIELVPRERIAAFEAAGWTRSPTFDRSHHGRWSALMTRRGRPDDTAEGIMAESARLRGRSEDSPSTSAQDQPFDERSGSGIRRRAAP